MTYVQCMQENQPFIDQTWKKIETKLPHSLAAAQGLDFIPYTTRGRKWEPAPFDGVSWWTNGFWPGLMWQMHLRTGEARYRQEAERAEEMLDQALEEFDHLHHDVGFMWLISAGANYRITGNPRSRRRALHAATLLAGRFNPKGFIRAWNDDKIGWAIIDCMMNLNLLYWASEETGDPRYRHMAMAHADTAMEHFVRPDGSVEHIVCFDPENGQAMEKPGGQGYASGSSWSRGQAWGVYGFALSYRHTGKEAYLRTAARIADDFLSCLSEDGIPRCDFRQPPEPDWRDSCAGAIAACGMLELAEALPWEQGEKYFQGALRMLRAMDLWCADWSAEEPAILQMCSASYHDKRHHFSMVYADFYFVEALARLKGEKFRFW